MIFGYKTRLQAFFHNLEKSPVSIGRVRRSYGYKKVTKQVTKNKK